MNFGEKVYQLRRNKGFSQEALAEQVGTTRQAVSKWENQQGYPEVETLLALSCVLSVSVDFLLKDDQTQPTETDSGVYVSLEQAHAYLAEERHVCRSIGAGFACLALAAWPGSICRSEPGAFPSALFLLLLFLGLTAFVLPFFHSNEPCETLEREPLRLDPQSRTALEEEYRIRRKKDTAVATFCTLLFCYSLLALAAMTRGWVAWADHAQLLFLTLAIGVFGFVTKVGTMEAYELLLHNEAYQNCLWNQWKRKLRSK